MITLIIKEPNPFFSYLDEKSFFDWLESIPAVKSVVGTPQGLEVSLESPLDEKNLSDLIAVMHRYGIEKKHLRDLCTSENESWFKNTDKYWYKSVFD